MKIREAKIQDVTGLINLWREFIDFHSAVEPLYSINEPPASELEEEFKSYVESGGHYIHVAEHNNALVGYIHFVTADLPKPHIPCKHGIILELFVSESFRRKKVGMQLFESVQCWLNKKDISRIHIRRASKNNLATAFWDELGFEPFIEELSLET